MCKPLVAYYPFGMRHVVFVVFDIKTITDWKFELSHGHKTEINKSTITNVGICSASPSVTVQYIYTKQFSGYTLKCWCIKRHLLSVYYDPMRNIGELLPLKTPKRE